MPLAFILTIHLLAATPARMRAPAPTPPRGVAWQSTPSAVLTAFYKACNDGLYSKAEQFATKESIDYIKTTFALLGGLKGYCDEMTEEGTLERVEVKDERVRGEGARLAIVLHYKGGKTERGEESLVKTASGWRVQVMGQGR